METRTASLTMFSEAITLDVAALAVKLQPDCLSDFRIILGDIRHYLLYQFGSPLSVGICRLRARVETGYMVS